VSNGRRDELVARLLERLLEDESFRAAFQRDPESILRAEGLDRLAGGIGSGRGKAMETLELRESRSNLAGLLMAVAAEGVGLVDSWQGRGGSSAGTPPPTGAGVAQGGAGAGAAPAPADPGARTPEQNPLIRAATPENAAAAQAHGDQVGLWSERSGTRAAQDARAIERANQVRELPVVDRSSGQTEPAARSSARSGREVAVDGPVKVDPGQYGQEGTGGPTVFGTDELLGNKHVTLDADAVSDLKAGRIDPRVVTVLNTLSERHDMTVSAMMSDHDQFTASGSVSNHYYGRALDISVVDGEAVNPANSAAHDVALSLGKLPEGTRPTEVGSPWDLPGTSDFTDASHQNHIHIGWDDQISSDWRPPGDVEHHHAGGGDAADAHAKLAGGDAPYPGDGASQAQIAAWMGAAAEQRGIPPELPVMAALVESNLQNLDYGDADSVGFFQMRTSIFDQGPYAGYQDDPDKQLDWFLDTAEAVKQQRVAAGLSVKDPSQYGEWVADIERPAEEYRGRYQPRLADAQELLKHADLSGGGDQPVLASDHTSGGGASHGDDAEDRDGESDGGGGGVPAADPAQPAPPPAPLDFDAQEPAQPAPAQVNVQFLEAVPPESSETES
jgi:hypothetical protein